MLLLSPLYRLENESTGNLSYYFRSLIYLEMKPDLNARNLAQCLIPLYTAMNKVEYGRIQVLSKNSHL